MVALNSSISLIHWDPCSINCSAWGLSNHIEISWNIFSDTDGHTPVISKGAQFSSSSSKFAVNSNLSGIFFFQSTGVQRCLCCLAMTWKFSFLQKVVLGFRINLVRFPNPLVFGNTKVRGPCLDKPGSYFWLYIWRSQEVSMPLCYPINVSANSTNTPDYDLPNYIIAWISAS